MAEQVRNRLDEEISSLGKHILSLIAHLREQDQLIASLDPATQSVLILNLKAQRDELQGMMEDAHRWRL